MIGTIAGKIRELDLRVMRESHFVDLMKMHFCEDGRVQVEANGQALEDVLLDDIATSPELLHERFEFGHHFGGGPDVIVDRVVVVSHIVSFLDANDSVSSVVCVIPLCMDAKYLHILKLDLGMIGLIHAKVGDQAYILHPHWAEPAVRHIVRRVK